MSKIFEIASRKAYRFPSVKGDITVEQLWQLPLTSTTGFALNNVAIDVNKQLKTFAEESFVNVKNTPGKVDTETKLEIVKHIIGVKEAEAAERLQEANNKVREEQLKEALEQHDKDALKNMSREQLLAELAKVKK